MYFYCCVQAPNNMKSVITSAWLCTAAFGNLIVIIGRLQYIIIHDKYIETLGTVYSTVTQKQGKSYMTNSLKRLVQCDATHRQVIIIHDKFIKTFGTV